MLVFIIQNDLIQFLIFCLISVVIYFGQLCLVNFSLLCTNSTMQCMNYGIVLKSYCGVEIKIYDNDINSFN